MEESLLYKNFILAQFAYLKCLESKRMPEILEFAKDKVANPKYFGFEESIPICHEIKKEQSEDQKSIKKKLALLFHPDKNPERVEEANILFSFIHNLKDDELLKSIHDSDDPWKTANLKMNSEIAQMETFCANAPNFVWFNIQNKSEYFKPIF
jgi:hypothetical protein